MVYSVVNLIQEILNIQPLLFFMKLGSMYCEIKVVTNDVYDRSNF
jgi:hypothetical protein